ncbi:MAG: Na/Pi cotransporter family protein [Candidatus Thiodiazotropha sp. (ex Ctena orbiculata)]|uniref:Na/Pi cotransporter family protein n=1 Tax=Candidatus Thiodiazotropha taylori TaxID=2792791 RepID=A0A944MDL5_9GAMM|nr:Na/Pi cotransporter family protein [Candidatus Thiodiazotropha taylori]PUB89595.1 MAG: NAD+ kinase [gamma proteobacterium symbiont of Ctena orbiculata]MBT2989487.1 Na/Pi cotransporter family protein [Candidatus Thiodiazotropha taylori]MBT2997067.1 Na/Pi cotransporter family protein [Candidatus Thiodiazotropha taylori]MBT3001221.1 Na/Pi cotransporter family protein [Candidatus Thiodiazotropha taylori]
MLGMLVTALCMSLALPVYAEGGVDAGIEWGVMGMRLFGGLALFLFGMEQLSDALKAVAGGRMKSILAKLTSNRMMGAVTGAFVTAVIQSSSVTTVLVVGFITAGLMSLSQSIGVIMGANVGTTITAQIVAFKVTKAALLMIGVGFTLLFAAKQERIKHYGAMLMGLGLVFFGMSIMSDGMKPLRSYQPFLDLMISMEDPLVGILVAAGFTSLVQSSSATTGIVIVMASQGFITLPAGIALAFGANIGTCVTAMLASIGKPREAVRAAIVHVIFNIAGVVLWLAFIPQLAELVTLISPSHPELSGIARLGAETPRQIANAHTLFNIANTLVFIGFTVQFARLVEWLIPDRLLEEEDLAVSAKYLDDELLATPSLALDRVRLEVLHMGERVMEMVDKIMPAILTGDHKSLDDVAMLDDEVDILYEQIIDYLGKISKQSMTDTQTEEFLSLMAAVGDLENIGDTIETNMVALGHERIDQGFSISEPTKDVLNGFQKVVKRSVDGAVQAVSQLNTQVAQGVIAMKDEINRMAESAAVHQAARLVAEEPNRIAAYTTEVDIIEKQKRIYYFAKRMAKTVLPPEEITEQ